MQENIYKRLAQAEAMAAAQKAETMELARNSTRRTRQRLPAKSAINSLTKPIAA